MAAAKKRKPLKESGARKKPKPRAWNAKKTAAKKRKGVSWGGR